MADVGHTAMPSIGHQKIKGAAIGAAPFGQPAKTLKERPYGRFKGEIAFGASHYYIIQGESGKI